MRPSHQRERHPEAVWTRRESLERRKDLTELTDWVPHSRLGRFTPFSLFGRANCVPNQEWCGLGNLLESEAFDKKGKPSR